MVPFLKLVARIASALVVAGSLLWNLINTLSTIEYTKSLIDNKGGPPVKWLVAFAAAYPQWIPISGIVLGISGLLLLKYGLPKLPFNHFRKHTHHVIGLPVKAGEKQIIESAPSRLQQQPAQLKGAELVSAALNQSKILVSCGRDVDMSVLTANKTTYFRGRLELDGIEPVRNLQAAITAIRKDGEKLQLNEPARLTFHPGYPVLNELRERSPEFVDVLKVEPDDRLSLALIGNYPAVDSYCCNDSPHAYELDVSISASNTRTRTVTFRFVWLERDTATFTLLPEPRNVWITREILKQQGIEG
jgi:hypothetical protein